MTPPTTDRRRDDDWQELLDDIEAYLDDHQDVNDGDDGRPVANRAMSLYTRLTELRDRSER